MRLRIDTNIILEVILEQAKSAEALALLAKANEHDFFLSEYSLHSLGILLFRRKQHEVYKQFLTDMILNAGMQVGYLSVKDMNAVIDVAQQFNLDFDDAYQYVTAEKYDLTIVSFDSDFDCTKLGRKTPQEVLP